MTIRQHLILVIIFIYVFTLIYGNPVDFLNLSESNSDTDEESDSTRESEEHASSSLSDLKITEETTPQNISDTVYEASENLNFVFEREDSIFDRL